MDEALKPPGRYMPMDDILSLTSVDAEAISDHLVSRGLDPIGTTVADILPAKQLEIERHPERWRPVELSMRMRGLTAPIGVANGYLINGMHRVALAVRAGWDGMLVTCDFEATTDHAWDEANPHSTWR